MSFGKRLKELREKKGLRQEDLGKLFHIGKSAISQWENGNRTPDSNTINKLADYFDVSLDYLLGRTNEITHGLPNNRTTDKNGNKNRLEILDALESDNTEITIDGQPISKEQKFSIIRALINPNKGGTPQVPIFGSVKAGASLLSEQNITGQVEIPADLEGKVDFALYVRDDSLIGAGINDNDIVLCKQQETASSGQIVAALVNETEITLKYFIQDNGKTFLKAANPKYKDIELKSGNQVQGYVVKILKDPPLLNTYKEYIYLKEGHKLEWNKIIEKSQAYGIKPSAFCEFADIQFELAKKLNMENDKK